ncbi:hypothetical protein BESB_071810 [Besnoitia besnoiti]|uniref:Calreticulin family protein n=1 Tax=Besnoitia besnoiti TaxID=94643 RepID=A0A2A9M7W9_BESBE|nr:uncharacterized protein BESB_071810 [Besnoitia besnoiti]PFH34029.1 hypothetical protein BESB_071810 [Besnoitia besnoiti]
MGQSSPLIAAAAAAGGAPAAIRDAAAAIRDAPATIRDASRAYACTRCWEFASQMRSLSLLSRRFSSVFLLALALVVSASLLSPSAPVLGAAASTAEPVLASLSLAASRLAVGVAASSQEDDVILPEDDSGFAEFDEGIVGDDLEEGEEDLLLMQQAATAAGRSAEREKKRREAPADGREHSASAAAANAAEGEDAQHGAREKGVVLERRAGAEGEGGGADEREERVRRARSALREEATNELKKRIDGAIQEMEKSPFPALEADEQILFLETFQDEPLESGRWVASADPKFQGEEEKPLERSCGSKGGRRAKTNGTETESLGDALQDDVCGVLGHLRKFHGISTRLPAPVNDTLKKSFVLQYEILQTRPLTCGGGYLKLLQFPQKQHLREFNHLTDYLVMFGPDVCGRRNQIHFILKIQNPLTGEWTEHHLQSPPKLQPSPFSTLLTLWIKPDDSFEILVDGVTVRTGSLLEDMEPPLQPPETLVVGTAADDDEAASDRRGNKATAASSVKNPAYFKLEHAHRLRDVNAIGLELWTVEGGTAFDNLLLADSIEAARKVAKATFEVRRVKEQELHRRLEQVHRAWLAEFSEKQRALEAEHEAAIKAALPPPSLLDALALRLEQLREFTGLPLFALAAVACCIV